MVAVDIMAAGGSPGNISEGGVMAARSVSYAARSLVETCSDTEMLQLIKTAVQLVPGAHLGLRLGDVGNVALDGDHPLRVEAAHVTDGAHSDPSVRVLHNMSCMMADEM